MLGKALVWAFDIVMSDVLIQYTPQMPFTDDDDTIQAFLSNASYPSFSKGIRVGRLHRRKQIVDPFTE